MISGVLDITVRHNNIGLENEYDNFSMIFTSENRNIECSEYLATLTQYNSVSIGMIHKNINLEGLYIPDNFTHVLIRSWLFQLPIKVKNNFKCIQFNCELTTSFRLADDIPSTIEHLIINDKLTDFTKEKAIFFLRTLFKSCNIKTIQLLDVSRLKMFQRILCDVLHLTSSIDGNVLMIEEGLTKSATKF